jgi:CNT family concentrative nucleoside transporter
MSDLASRAVSALGMTTMVVLAWTASNDRRRIPWRIILSGTAIQFALALLMLRTEPGRRFFVAANDAVNGFIGYTDTGVRFVFGALADSGFSFVINVLPIIVFMGSLFAVFYHIGIVQPVVGLLARALARSLGTSGAESLSAVANIFLGMVEAPLLIRPYLAAMTESELFCVMTTGMAGIAGSVLVAYVQMLGGGDFAGHLVISSILTAPAGILIAKVMVPERGVPETGAGGDTIVEPTSLNLIDAAATGAADGLRVAAYVGATLLAFVAAIAMLNDALAAMGGVVGIEGLTFQRVLGWVMAPIAWLMGIPWSEATRVGGLLGIKTVLNEFLAYQELGELIKAGALTHRSAVIASYALCGFANFGSLAIMLGGLGGMAPTRRGDVARLGLRSILAGSLATFMTACIAGVLL